MTRTGKRQYEGMFLFDPTFATAFEDCEREINRLMERAGAELLLCQRWDERRLAFKVEGRKRGVYVLTYFLADPPKIRGIERDAQLSENILRLLVLQAEGLQRDAMERWAASGAQTEVQDGGEPSARDSRRERGPRRRTEADSGGDDRGPEPSRHRRDAVPEPS